MKRTRAFLIVIIALLSGAAAPLVPPAQAAFGNGSRGTSGAAFLKIGPGARPAAMGEAFSAVADDAHAVYYNPAGLAGLAGWELTGMHDEYFQGLDYDFLAAAAPVAAILRKKPGSEESLTPPRRDLGSVAFAAYSLSAEGIERRGTTDTDEPQGTFGGNDLALAFAYAKKYDRKLSLGGSLKFVRLSLDDKSATAFAADFGALYKYSPRLRLGSGLRHLGTRPKFVGVSDPLPALWYAGAAFEARPGLLASFDLTVPRDRSPVVALGGEYRSRLADGIDGALRAGYFTRNADAEGFGGVSLGGGIRYGRLDCDFAWVPFGDLGNTFRFSLLMRF